MLIISVCPFPNILMLLFAALMPWFCRAFWWRDISICQQISVMSSTDFWEVTPFSPVEDPQRFGGVYYHV
jgi:hypothetical protein